MAAPTPESLVTNFENIDDGTSGAEKHARPYQVNWNTRFGVTA